MPFGKTLTATTMALGLAMTGASVTALTAQSAAAQEAAEYSGEQLDAFTVAYLQVIDLREKYVPVLQAAESQDQQQAIIEEANAEMVEAIESTDGMTLDDYESIAQAAAEDQDLNARIMARIEDMAQPAE
ncbi:DUF4168 domain-containing protein [Rhodosalinus sp. K401]|uniref:DUF4168 domain-containing protein n=1 Tax=Rhodosalinus sp. K401 TaxID=3239195 RepID=UPI003523D0E5